MERRQRGFAMLIVMALAAVAMLGATSLLGDGAVAEKRAQETELLRLRAYWAAEGHISYALSRGRQGPPCGGSCADLRARADFYAAALGELHDYDRGNLIGLGAGKERRWDFPEIGATYHFPVRVSARRNSGTTRIEFETTFQVAQSIEHEFIKGVWPVRRNLAYFVCAGMTSGGGACPASAGEMDVNSGIADVARMSVR